MAESGSQDTGQHEIDSEHRIAALDGLRGFAALSVIVSHLFPRVAQPGHWWERIYNGLIDMGWSGVDLFFVLSGFLITSILIQHRQSKNYFRCFYARRVLRIVPLYFLLCVAVIFVLPLVLPMLSLDYPRAPGNPAYYFLFLNNYSDFLSVPDYRHLGIAWSLAIEEQFYLVWPFLIRYLDRRKALFACTGLFVGTVVLRNLLYLNYEVPAQTLYLVTITHMDGIAIGSIAAILLSEPERYRSWIRFLRSQVVFTAPALVLVFILCVLSPVESLHLSYHPLMVIAGHTLCALVFCALLLHCVLGRSVLTTFFHLSVMKRTGHYSYAMYLLHQVAWSAFNVIFRSTGLPRSLYQTPLPFLLSLALTCALAAVSYRIVERRFLALKRHFAF